MIEYCTWKEEDPNGPTPNTWEGECKYYYYAGIEYSLMGQDMKYCPKCGGGIREVPYPVELEEG